jgi:hypothetical protein
LSSTSILEKTGSTGKSVVGVNVANNGEILVSRGTLEINGNVTGSAGALSIQGASTLQLDKSVAAGQSLSFSGSGGELTLGSAGSYAGTIADFASGEQIDALHFGRGTTVSFVENAANTRGTLTIHNGAMNAQLALIGQYIAAGFGHTSTSAGTVITYTPPASTAETLVNPAVSH